MIISHVKIIAFQTITNHSFWTFYIGEKPVVYIINRKIHECLEIPDLFLVLNMIFLVKMISCSTLEINLVFPRIHVLFSIYFTRSYKLQLTVPRLHQILHDWTACGKRSISGENGSTKH